MAEFDTSQAGAFLSGGLWTDDTTTVEVPIYGDELEAELEDDDLVAELE